MLKNVTLGQFFPGDTVIHRLDPRTKLLFVVIYIVALFLAKTWTAYVVVGAVLIAGLVLSKISLKVITSGLKPILVLVVFTGVLNLFFTTGDVVFELWIIKITREGIVMAVTMVFRIFMLILGTQLLTYTTSPLSLTDGLERLLSPLKVLHVPVHELAMMMSIALRFIPTLIEETDKIISAQKARGAEFDTGSLLQRAKALIPLLVPLFISAFRRADELAIAMESRCYHGGEGRTRMKVLRMQTADWACLGTAAVMTAAVIILGRV